MFNFTVLVVLIIIIITCSIHCDNDNKQEYIDEYELRPIEVSEKMLNSSTELLFRFHELDIKTEDYYAHDADYEEITALLESSKKTLVETSQEYAQLFIERTSLGRVLDLTKIRCYAKYI